MIDVLVVAGKIWLHALICGYLLWMCAGAHPPRHCDKGGADAVAAQEQGHIAACRQQPGRGRAGCAPNVDSTVGRHQVEGNVWKAVPTMVSKGGHGWKL